MSKRAIIKILGTFETIFVNCELHKMKMFIRDCPDCEHFNSKDDDYIYCGYEEED